MSTKKDTVQMTFYLPTDVAERFYELVEYGLRGKLIAMLVTDLIETMERGHQETVLHKYLTRSLRASDVSNLTVESNDV